MYRPKRTAKAQKNNRQIAQQSATCNSMKHAMVKQGQTVCISQIPISECGRGCFPRSTINKTISFTCLPSNRPRVVNMYEEKIRSNEILPELRSMDKTFSSKMEVCFLLTSWTLIHILNMTMTMTLLFTFY